MSAGNTRVVAGAGVRPSTPITTTTTPSKLPNTTAQQPALQGLQLMHTASGQLLLTTAPRPQQQQQTVTTTQQGLSSGSASALLQKLQSIQGIKSLQGSVITMGPGGRPVLRLPPPSTPRPPLQLQQNTTLAAPATVVSSQQVRVNQSTPQSTPQHTPYHTPVPSPTSATNSPLRAPNGGRSPSTSRPSTTTAPTTTTFSTTTTTTTAAASAAGGSGGKDAKSKLVHDRKRSLFYLVSSLFVVFFSSSSTPIHEVSYVHGCINLYYAYY